MHERYAGKLWRVNFKKAVVCIENDSSSLILALHRTVEDKRDKEREFRIRDKQRESDDNRTWKMEMKLKRKLESLLN